MPEGLVGSQALREEDEDEEDEGEEEEDKTCVIHFANFIDLFVIQSYNRILIDYRAEVYTI